MDNGSLFALPVELLYDVFILSSSHVLPLTCKYLHAVFKAAPSSVQAEYILHKYLDEVAQNARANRGIVTKALRYPVCTESVLEAIFRLPTCPTDVEKSQVELPRRLFRSLAPRSIQPWTREDHPLPFLDYLYSHPHIPRPHPDSWEGYPLTKAVASRFMPLVRFMLDQGASPALKNGLAVHVAIRLRDLALVKLLIEPTDSALPGSHKEEACTKRARVEIRRKQSENDLISKSTKKRKLEDRVEVSQEMLQTAVACNARDIVEYFMQEKSCMPDMQTVKLIGTAAHNATTSGDGGRRKRRKVRR